MQRIKTLNQVAKIAKDFKKRGKTIGLITGCFDILHVGHVELFRYAKSHADIVIVGLDSDKTIKVSKGKGHPIHSLDKRQQALSELRSVDYVFSIPGIFSFKSVNAEQTHEKIIKKIIPDFLFTNQLADNFWKEKRNRANKLNVQFLGFKKKPPSSSTVIANKIASEL